MNPRPLAKPPTRTFCRKSGRGRLFLISGLNLCLKSRYRCVPFPHLKSRWQYVPLVLCVQRCPSIRLFPIAIESDRIGPIRSLFLGFRSVRSRFDHWIYDYDSIRSLKPAIGAIRIDSIGPCNRIGIARSGSVYVTVFVCNGFCM